MMVNSAWHCRMILARSSGAVLIDDMNAAPVDAQPTWTARLRHWRAVSGRRVLCGEVMRGVQREGEKVNGDESDVSSSCQQSGLNKPSLHSPTDQHPPSTIQEPRHVSGRDLHFRHLPLQGDDLA